MLLFFDLLLMFQAFAFLVMLIAYNLCNSPSDFFCCCIERGQDAGRRRGLFGDDRDCCLLWFFFVATMGMNFLIVIFGTIISIFTGFSSEPEICDPFLYNIAVLNCVLGFGVNLCFCCASSGNYFLQERG